MTVEISDDLRIEKEDEHNWIVKTGQKVQKGRDPGRIRWSNFGYYSTLEAACRGCLEIKAARSKSVHRGLDSAVSELRALWEEIRTAAEPIRQAAKAA